MKRVRRFTILVLQEAVVSHQDPMVMEGGCSAAVVKDSRIVRKQLLKCLQVTWIGLMRERGMAVGGATAHT